MEEREKKAKQDEQKMFDKEREQVQEVDALTILVFVILGITTIIILFCAYYK